MSVVDKTPNKAKSADTKSSAADLQRKSPPTVFKLAA